VLLKLFADESAIEFNPLSATSLLRRNERLCRTLKMNRKIKGNEINQNDQQQSFLAPAASHLSPRALTEKGSPCAKKCQFLLMLMRVGLECCNLHT
jgi:hypothetical protein